jgi:hypothetical protein
MARLDSAAADPINRRLFNHRITGLNAGGNTAEFKKSQSRESH